VNLDMLGVYRYSKDKIVVKIVNFYQKSIVYVARFPTL